MVTTGALRYGSVERHLRLNAEEHPVALQLGGSVAADLAFAYIGTDMVKAIRPDVLEKIVVTVPVKRLGEPSEIASIIAWLVL
jgi:NAD(P)-dependent dehydrogenase (short-subunit alcohol dehydrogenase family)